eukprot:GHVL01021735.1.p1 GENE.GHVL01021735.1~~GHVL01021735.1.p1  ORF type:complete len:642 (-),score=79.75 GHVL01021735.1:711-2636(-)
MTEHVIHTYEQTPHIDLSMIYGSNSRAESVVMLSGVSKAATNTVRGKIRVPDDYPHLITWWMTTVCSDLEHDHHVNCTNGNWLSASLQALFTKEHNRIAARYSAWYPVWTHEQVYMAARRLNVAQFQKIIFYDYARILLGEGVFTSLVHTGQKSSDRHSTFAISEFIAMFRSFLHTQLPNEFQYIKDDGKTDRVSLKQNKLLRGGLSLGLDTVIRGLLKQGAPAAGEFYPDKSNFAVEDCLAGQIGKYVSTVSMLGLAELESFDEITKDHDKNEMLKKLYNNDLENVDLVIGAVIEDKGQGAIVGSAFQKIFAEQLLLWKTFDPNWFENKLSENELSYIMNRNLADVIYENSDLRVIQNNAFIVPSRSDLRGPNQKQSKMPDYQGEPIRSRDKCDGDWSFWGDCNDKCAQSRVFHVGLFPGATSKPCEVTHGTMETRLCSANTCTCAECEVVKNEGRCDQWTECSLSCFQERHTCNKVSMEKRPCTGGKCPLLSIAKGHTTEIIEPMPSSGESSSMLVGVDAAGKMETFNCTENTSCTVACPCGAGEGSCDFDRQCEDGLVCQSSPRMRFCRKAVPMVQSDPSRCNYGHMSGNRNFCTLSCPCRAGEGICNSDSHCESGLLCEKQVLGFVGFCRKSAPIYT